MARHRLRKRGTPFDILGHLFQHVSQHARSLLLLQNADASQNRQAGVLECRKLTRERRERLGRNAEAETGSGGLSLRALLLPGSRTLLVNLFDDLRREEA